MDDRAVINWEVKDAGAGNITAKNNVTGETFTGTKTAFNALISGLVVGKDSALVAPTLSAGGHIAAVTSVTGTPYVAFASQVCKQLTICNGTGVDISVIAGGSGVAVPVFTGTYMTFFGITNADQLSVRRTDTGIVQVTVPARWEA